MKPMADDAASDSTSEPTDPPATGAGRRPAPATPSAHQSGRLRRRADFEAVFRGGRVARGRVLRMTVRPNDLGYHRVGLTVSTRVGGAVVRNRVKRRLRAILREAVKPGHPLPASNHGSDYDHDTESDADASGSMDIVVTALPSAARASYQELTDDIARTIEKLRLSRPEVDVGGVVA